MGEMTWIDSIEAYPNFPYFYAKCARTPPLGYGHPVMIRWHARSLTFENMHGQKYAPSKQDPYPAYLAYAYPAQAFNAAQALPPYYTPPRPAPPPPPEPRQSYEQLQHQLELVTTEKNMLDRILKSYVEMDDKLNGLIEGFRDLKSEINHQHKDFKRRVTELLKDGIKQVEAELLAQEPPRVTSSGQARTQQTGAQITTGQQGVERQNVSQDAVDVDGSKKRRME